MNELWNVKKTQIEMIQDRGYIIPKEEQWILNEPYNKKKFKNLSLNKTYVDNNNIKTYVHYLNLNSDETFNKVLQIINEKKINVSILIGETNIIKILLKNYKKYFKNNFETIQVFTYDELIFNITTHYLSPKYELISKNFIVPTVASINQLPIMMYNDPIRKYYNWDIGSIIKIEQEYDLDMINKKDINYCVIKNTNFNGY